MHNGQTIHQLEKIVSIADGRPLPHLEAAISPVAVSENRRFCEVYFDSYDGVWCVILHASWDKEGNAGEQEFVSLDWQAQFYMREWVERGKVVL